MNNRFGHQVTLTLFGESHGEAIGAVLDGLAAGIPVDEAFIAQKLKQRRPSGAISTPRQEPDTFKLVSGVYRGYTNGAPLAIVIPNTDTRSGDYAPFAATPRPGHADYTGSVRAAGFNDPRGGGHFSGRITAALVAAGGVLIPALQKRGVHFATHLAQIGPVADEPFTGASDELARLNAADFAVLSAEQGEKMKAHIRAAAAEGDSVGGVLETVVTGLPVGVGEPWFDTLEGCLAHALFAVPGVKGVEFGDGFALTQRRGSEANDCFVSHDGRVATATNHNGGINGGLSNGMPVVFRCAVKPTPTIHRAQHTLNVQTGEMTDLLAGGRHDPCIVPRARAVVDSLTALVLMDLLCTRFGEDWPVRV